MAANKKYDLVLFGATGFVGKLTAQYLATHAPSGVRLAIAGRNRDKLAEVVQQLDSGDRYEILLADVGDQASLDRLAAATKVVVTTVGPYTTYGLPMVRACVENGTDYADLTGEPIFVRRCIDMFHKEARDTGARIVPSCGFDSVPSDLSVHLLYERATVDGAGDLRDTTLVVRRIRGGISGGTAASGLAMGRDMAADRAAWLTARDPYTLSHVRSDEPELGAQPDGRLVALDTVHGELRGWAGGFFMAPHNTRVVRRSNTIRDWAYGRQFRYSEVMAVPGGPASLMPAAAMAGGLRAAFAMAPALRLVPDAIVTRLAPRPGTGPSERSRSKGHFTFQTFAETGSGARYRTTFGMRGDPGYAATAVILGQAGLTLAEDRDQLSPPGGVLTPATAMGSPLAARLVAAGAHIVTEQM